ncbi:UNVERIFIED_CONTAM: hypothetical protein FKN15_008183 [Acipenser sinensis]
MWERLWFLVLCSTFFLILFWLYFWWEVHNDYNEFNWTGYWSDWSIPILFTTAAGFSYVAFLLATGPFLHLGAVAAITLLAWLVAGQFARAEKKCFQAVLLLTYLTVLTALYLVPLSITSPCLMEKNNLGPKPAIIGHQGAPMLAPENTLMSFQKAVEEKASGLYADVTISHDGVPFLMHDNTLRRTTDVEKLFPERAGQDSSMFNWTDLQALNAGQWFLKDDPFWTASSLSEADWDLAGNQSVCTLSEVLQLAKNSSKSILFNVRRPPPEHPHRESWINVTLHTVLQCGIQQQHVSHCDA